MDLDNMQIAQQTLIDRITEQVGRAWEMNFEQLRGEMAVVRSSTGSECSWVPCDTI